MKAICIKCWDADATVKLHMDGSGDFECGGCDESFTCAEVRDTLDAMKRGWEKLIGWAESYPVEEEEEAEAAK
jgi:hypothetical protein